MDFTDLPEPGQLVEVRRRQFVVTDVVPHEPTKDPMPQGSNGRTHVVRLLSLEEDAIDDVQEVIWEMEPDIRVHGKPRLPDPSSIDDTWKVDTFLNAMRWSVVDSIEHDFGKVGPDFEEQAEEAMLGRRVGVNTRVAEKEAEPVQRMPEIERDMRDHIQRIKKYIEESETDFRGTPTPNNLKLIVELGLDLAGYPKLIPATSNGEPVDWSLNHAFFLVPSLRGSWAECVRGLEHPQTGEVRAITFDHEIAAGRNDVVLCHLNHPLMQMCRRLLCAEVWADEEKRILSRFTIRAVPDSVGVHETLFVYARLLITGGTGRRLHEEIIRSGIGFISSRTWRMTLRQEDGAMSYSMGYGVGPEVHPWFVQLWTESDELETAAMRALDARAEERMKRLQQAFAKRRKKEIKDLTKPLNELAQTIREELKAEGPDQSGFNAEESERREENVAALKARFKSIQSEIGRETLEIKDRYSDLRTWVLPVAMTLLYPYPINLG